MSTVQEIESAVQRLPVAQAHLRHLNPFPSNLGEVLRSYDTVLVPEMNLGQLSMLLKARFDGDIQPVTKVRGLARWWGRAQP